LFEHDLRANASRLSQGKTGSGTLVSEDYQVPFKFPGDLKKAAIQLTDAVLSAEDEAEIKRIGAEIGLSE
jgi:hypothetical protein